MKIFIQRIYSLKKTCKLFIQQIYSFKKIGNYSFNENIHSVEKWIIAHLNLSQFIHHFNFFFWKKDLSLESLGVIVQLVAESHQQTSLAPTVLADQSALSFWQMINTHSKTNIMQCFRKRNLAMQTWRSKALQWGLLCEMRPNCGPFQQFRPHEDQVLNWGLLWSHCKNR